VLCLGAHCDDIEIGAGGSIIRLIEQSPDVDVHWVVFSSTPVREQEARDAAACFLAGARRSNVRIEQFRERYFPFIGASIKDYFDDLGKAVRPDIVFTHSLDDRHQDHRLIAELTWNTFRDHLILEYEIPKYEGDLGHPNVFVALDDDTASRKVDHLTAAFQSQQDKEWFTASTFKGLMRLRGIEAKAPGGYAEAFSCRKLVLV
jgi:LmbE family N-acetylglucosaminyl deacetylase